MSVGVVNTSNSYTSTGFFSAGGADAVTDNKERASGTGFIGGIGASAALGTLTNPFATGFGSPTNPMRYAADPKEAMAADFPIKAPAKPLPPRSVMVWGIDGNVYFFAGGNATINGIPGGPFGTATGADSFNVRNNVMFTLGAFLTVPVTPDWSVSLTGGFAEMNQTVKYNCVTFCAVAPAAAAFTASQDVWVPGGYVGARLSTPVTLPWVGQANIGIDYKHVFFGNYDVALGTVVTRQVNARLSPDMDLVTLRLSVPLR